MSSKTKVAAARDTLGEQLIAIGYKRLGSQGKSSANRTVYKNDNWQILLPTLEVPSITLQRLDRVGVDWFVDFPMAVELSAILIFAEASS